MMQCCSDSLSLVPTRLQPNFYGVDMTPLYGEALTSYFSQASLLLMATPSQWHVRCFMEVCRAIVVRVAL
jgi:hypothetical protein